MRAHLFFFVFMHLLLFVGRGAWSGAPGAFGMAAAPTCACAGAGAALHVTAARPRLGQRNYERGFKIGLRARSEASQAVSEGSLLFNRDSGAFRSFFMISPLAGLPAAFRAPEMGAAPGRTQ
jgi:hypothetical protein